MASITLTFAPADAVRIRAALTAIRNDGQQATAQDFENWMTYKLRQLVLNHEREQAVAAVQIPAFDISVSQQG